MWQELAYGLKEGNGYLIAMSILFAFSLIIIFERLIMLHFVYNINFRKFLNDIKKMVLSNDIDRAMNRCKGASKTSLPKITLQALKASETDPSTVKGTIEEETIEFLPNLERRLEFLPAMATLVLLIGVLGTLDGLWSTFHSINILDTAKKQASLAEGVASTLNPTALGIVLTMIILASHHFLRSAAIRLAEKVHYGVAVIHNILVPAEVPTFVAAAMPAAQMGVDSALVDSLNADVSDTKQTKSKEEEFGGLDDAFDDASIEDIKDEEEII